jgi:hypothetical protein
MLSLPAGNALLCSCFVSRLDAILHADAFICRKKGWLLRKILGGDDFTPLIEKKNLVGLLGLYIHRSGGSSDDRPGPNTYT